MDNIMQAVSDLVAAVGPQVRAYMGLFFNGRPVHATVLGLFCIVLPLVGLGIGIIRRLVRFRA